MMHVCDALCSLSTPAAAWTKILSSGLPQSKADRALPAARPQVYGAHYSHDVHDAAAYGWNLKEEGLDWPRFLANKNKEIARLNGVYANLLKTSGVEVRNCMYIIFPLLLFIIIIIVTFIIGSFLLF